MAEHALTYLTGIIVLGVTALWVAWRVGLPSILLLLVCGLVAGPVTGWLKPDDVFGDLLSPVVSLAVALILYEGGLTLRLAELPKVGAVVRNLVLLGASVTWIIGSLAAYYLLGFSPSVAALVGAVLVVTGPTVVSPLLRFIRPTGAVGPMLKWEGIVIDPIGALLAVLVFESIRLGATREASVYVLAGIAKTVLIGGGLGLAAAGLLTLLLHRHWIADHLENAVSLMLVVATFAISHHVQHESGLLAVTVMGFALANQKWADVGNIVEFKENLQVLLISSLFIVLAARVELADLRELAPQGLLFVAVLVFVARPLCVFVSTIGSTLSRKEKLFLAWMAPRGIVAAAVASVFALRLEEAGIAGADKLVPITFITIIATVAIYGLTASIVARKLGLAESNPQGLLFVGAHEVARSLALILQNEGVRVLLVDSNREHIKAAKMAGLPAHTGSILAEHTLEKIELGGIGRLLAVTPNDWVNILAVHRFERIFGRANCYQLPPHQDDQKKKRHKYLHGRWLFGEDVTYPSLARRLREGCSPKATGLTDEFDFDALQERYGESTVPLFVIDQRGGLTVANAAEPPEPRAGDKVISFVNASGA